MLNKEAKIVLKKARYKIGESTRKLSHSLSKPSPERVMKKCLKCLNLMAPQMAKKNPPLIVCQVTPSSSQTCKDVQKPCCGRGRG